MKSNDTNVRRRARYKALRLLGVNALEAGDASHSTARFRQLLVTMGRDPRAPKYAALCVDHRGHRPSDVIDANGVRRRAEG